MKHARTIAILSALALGVTVFTAGSAANASTSCSVSATVPAHLTILSMETDLPVTLHGPAACVGPGNDALYSIAKSGAPFDKIMLSNGSTVVHSFVPHSQGPGSYSAVNGDARDVMGQQFPAATSNVALAKYGSKLETLSLARAGSTVTFTVKASHYSYAVDNWVGWGNATIQFQYWSGSAWVTAVTAVTDSTATASARIALSARSWRAVAGERPTIWPAVTASAYK